MRLGVLDIGSNTGHLLVVDAHGGAAPSPASSYKEPLRLAEHLDSDGAVTERGIAALTEFVGTALELAEDKGCEEIYGFATSAVRDAVNADAVLEHVFANTGARITVLSGEAEARLTFLAVRRWFGWSSGRLGVFDIGGGSLEIAAGSAEAPTSRGRCHWVPAGSPAPGSRTAVPTRTRLRDLRKSIRADIARQAGSLLRGGPLDHAVATSKTFRSLGRDLRVGAVQRGSLRAPDAASRRPGELAAQARRDVARGDLRAAGRLARSCAPGGGRRVRGLRGSRHLRHQRASRSARGRCARVSSSIDSTSSACWAEE